MGIRVFADELTEMTQIWVALELILAMIGLRYLLAARNRRCGCHKTRDLRPSELEYLAAFLAEDAMDRPNISIARVCHGERRSQERVFGELVTPLGSLN